MSFDILSWQQLLCHPVCIEHIVPHLPIIDYMSLLRALPRLRHSTSESKRPFPLFMHRLRVWLLQQNLPFDFVTFLCIQLHVNPSMYKLTGSVVLMLLTDVAPFANWNKHSAGDLDIIYTGKEHMLDNVMYGRFYLSQTQLPAMDRDETRETHLYYSSLLLGVQNRHAMGVDRPFKVQFLRCENHTTSLDYVKTFDLSFCKNVVYHGKLMVYHPHDVVKRKMEQPIDVTSTYFPHDMSCIENVFHNYLPKRYLRLRKYALRGFDFRLRVPLPEMLDDPNLTLVDDYRKGVISGMWYLFWNYCIQNNQRIDVACYPNWKKPTLVQ